MALLLGGNRYVGKPFCWLWHATGVQYRVLSRTETDYSNELVFADTIRATRTTFVMNCAGNTGRPNVEACKQHKAESLIRKACKATDTPWGHVSSGCIYSGCRPDRSGRQETDPPNFSFRPNNSSFYRSTKALGEELLAVATGCYIWPLRMPFHKVDKPRNYLSPPLQYDRLRNARNSFSQLNEFAVAAWRCGTQRIRFGINNVTNPSPVTTRQAVKWIRTSGLARRDFQFFTDETEFIRSEAYVPRSHCVPDTRKLERVGIQLTEVHEAVAHALREWREGTA